MASLHLPHGHSEAQALQHCHWKEWPALTCSQQHIPLVFIWALSPACLLFFNRFVSLEQVELDQLTNVAKKRRQGLTGGTCCWTGSAHLVSPHCRGSFTPSELVSVWDQPESLTFPFFLILFLAMSSHIFHCLSGSYTSIFNSLTHQKAHIWFSYNSGK